MSASTYTPEFNGEFVRLEVQAKNNDSSDCEVIDEAVNSINKDQITVLDLGCAYGALGKLIFGDDKFVKVIGVDADDLPRDHDITTAIAKYQIKTISDAFKKLDKE